MIVGKLLHIFFKLPCMVLSLILFKKKNKRQLVEHYCNNLDIKLVFSSFKIQSVFGVKDSIASELCSQVFYKLLYANCNASNMDETNRHFSTHERERFHVSFQTSTGFRGMPLVLWCLSPFWTPTLQCTLIKRSLL